MEKDAKILVLGAGGMIGGRIADHLKQNGYAQVCPCGHAELDLTDQTAVRTFFSRTRPEYVFFSAVKSIADFSSNAVGEADELSENVMMLCNTMECCKNFGVKRAAILGSAMLYPWNLAPYPKLLTEDMLEKYNLSGYSKSMESAVLSKLFAYKLCQFYRRQYGCDYIYCLPVHIYGGLTGRKNFYFTERMVMDMCEAKHKGKAELFLDVYGKGIAKRNLLHVDDCADAIITVMERYCGEEGVINIASDEIVSWRTVVDSLCKITDYHGKILFNEDREENLTSRVCSCRKLREMGWTPKYDIERGLRELCAEYAALKGWKME